ncbi:hypothetical protein [Advenella kashmirensis]|nr:hypothetical protein [Advenella kashmirensis]
MQQTTTSQEKNKTVLERFLHALIFEVLAIGYRPRWPPCSLVIP